MTKYDWHGKCAVCVHSMSCHRDSSKGAFCLQCKKEGVLDEKFMHYVEYTVGGIGHNLAYAPIQRKRVMRVIKGLKNG